jgi:UPF0716 family protein affecting phage T7 exclusion
MPLRLALGFAGFMLVVPGTFTDLIAAAIAVPILVYAWMTRR